MTTPPMPDAVFTRALSLHDGPMPDVVNDCTRLRVAAEYVWTAAHERMRDTQPAVAGEDGERLAQIRKLIEVGEVTRNSAGKLLLRLLDAANAKAEAAETDLLTVAQSAGISYEADGVNSAPGPTDEIARSIRETRGERDTLREERDTLRAERDRLAGERDHWQQRHREQRAHVVAVQDERDKALFDLAHVEASHLRYEDKLAEAQRSLADTARFLGERQTEVATLRARLAEAERLMSESAVLINGAVVRYPHTPWPSGLAERSRRHVDALRAFLAPQPAPESDPAFAAALASKPPVEGRDYEVVPAPEAKRPAAHHAESRASWFQVSNDGVTWIDAPVPYDPEDWRYTRPQPAPAAPEAKRVPEHCRCGEHAIDDGDAGVIHDGETHTRVTCSTQPEAKRVPGDDACGPWGASEYTMSGSAGSDDQTKAAMLGVPAPRVPGVGDEVEVSFVDEPGDAATWVCVKVDTATASRFSGWTSGGAWFSRSLRDLNAHDGGWRWPSQPGPQPEQVSPAPEVKRAPGEAPKVERENPFMSAFRRAAAIGTPAEGKRCKCGALEDPAMLLGDVRVADGSAHGYSSCKPAAPPEPARPTFADLVSRVGPLPQTGLATAEPARADARPEGRRCCDQQVEVREGGGSETQGFVCREHGWRNVERSPTPEQAPAGSSDASYVARPANPGVKTPGACERQCHDDRCPEDAETHRCHNGQCPFVTGGLAICRGEQAPAAVGCIIPGSVVDVPSPPAAEPAPAGLTDGVKLTPECMADLIDSMVIESAMVCREVFERLGMKQFADVYRDIAGERVMARARRAELAAAGGKERA